MRDHRPKALFITGAGLSADSGIATYRGAGGVYEGMSAETLMSARTMRTRPEAVQRFCDDRRRDLADKSRNSAHEMIGSLMTDFPGRVAHATMNVDGLSPDGSVELHGRLSRMRSIGNSTVTEDIGSARYWDGDPALAPSRGFQFRCPKTNSRYRPGVVLFDEPAPEYTRLYRALKALRPRDVLVVIGTQGNVLPVSSFAAKAPCMSVLNNLHASEHIRQDDFDIVLPGRAADMAAAIDDIVRSTLSTAS